MPRKASFSYIEIKKTVTMYARRQTMPSHRCGIRLHLIP